MQTFIMLTRLSPDAAKLPKSFADIEKRVMDRVRAECPEIEWVHNLAVLGPYDYVDIFRAPSELSAFKLAAIIRTFGHCTTEVWSATEWGRFKEIIYELAEAA
jgi:uncharacterized protein with GYD domain